MKNVGKWALCLMVCLAIVGFGIVPAMAEHGWEEGPPQKGKPSDPPNPTMAPTYYGQPMMLDENPWIDEPGKKNKPNIEASPTVGPSAWWMQPALDYHTWGEDPPKGKEPQTP